MTERPGGSVQGEPDPAELQPRDEAGPPRARVRETGWRGWVWSVPLAALLVVGYLLVKHLLLHGPSVTVTFPSTEGISGTSQTPVRYRGVEVGTVASVELGDSMGSVVMHLAMDGSVSDALRKGTRFWIVQPSLLGGGLSNLLSGPWIEMEPGTGEKTRHFQGLVEPPRAEVYGPGTTFIVRAPASHGIGPGAPVVYHGLQAGQVVRVALASDPDRVRMEVFVRAPFDRLVREGSSFWRCGGVGLSGGGGLSLPPLSRLLQGCVAFDSFGSAGVAAAAPDHEFRLYDGEDAARHPLVGTPVAFTVRVPGSVAGLTPGSPVELQGVPVGDVQDVALDVAPAGVETPVTVELYPASFGLAADSAAGGAEALYGLLNDLVRRGLRARVASQGLILGGKEVQLAMTGAPGRSLDLARTPPLIPATGGGDIQGVIADLGGFADQLDRVPLGDIGDNLRDASRRLDALVSSPHLDASVQHMDHAMANVDTLTGEARDQVGPILDELRSVTAQLQGAASRVDAAVGGSVRDQRGLSDLVDELDRAARSIRTLTDYLSRHPEAILKGRSGG